MTPDLSLLKYEIFLAIRAEAMDDFVTGSDLRYNAQTKRSSSSQVIFVQIMSVRHNIQ
jgi:hypothetical protein